MKSSEQKILKYACHELRSVRATLQAGFQHIRNPQVDPKKAESLCRQGLNRLDQVLDELEKHAVRNVALEQEL